MEDGELGVAMLTATTSGRAKCQWPTAESGDAIVADDPVSALVVMEVDRRFTDAEAYAAAGKIPRDINERGRQATTQHHNECVGRIILTRLSDM